MWEKAQQGAQKELGQMAKDYIRAQQLHRQYPSPHPSRAKALCPFGPRRREEGTAVTGSQDECNEAYPSQVGKPRGCQLPETPEAQSGTSP